MGCAVGHVKAALRIADLSDVTDDITALIDGALTAPRGESSTDETSTPAPVRGTRRAQRTTTESPYAAYTAELARSVPAPGESRSVLDRHLLTVVATLLALPAVRAPLGWFALCGVAAVVMLTVDSAGRRARAARADGTAPRARVAALVIRGVLNPLNWLTAVFGAVIALAAGALIAAAVGAVRWLLLDGIDGVAAAARIGVWAHAPTYAAAVACFLLLRAGGRTADHRQQVLRALTGRVPDAALAGIVVVVAVVCVALALAGPRLDVGLVHGSDDLGWVPSPLRALVDDGRDDIVAAEISAVTSCLDNGQDGMWAAAANAGAPITDPDVVTLTADPSRPPDQVGIAMTALAADNHLAPWVETINVVVGGQLVLSVDRRGVARDAPITDAQQLRARSAGNPEWLTAVAPQVDRAFVLRCSAQTPL